MASSGEVNKKLKASVIYIYIYIYECLDLCINTRACLESKIKITVRLLLLLLNQSAETRVNVHNEPILL